MNDQVSTLHYARSFMSQCHFPALDTISREKNRSYGRYSFSFMSRLSQDMSRFISQFHFKPTMTTTGSILLSSILNGEAGSLNGLYRENNSTRASILPSFADLMVRSQTLEDRPCKHCDRLATIRELCLLHLKQSECRLPQNRKLSVIEKKPKKPRRRCEAVGCMKFRLKGGRCIAHGGGRRCRHSGCQTAAQSGGFCKIHGGGSRCKMPECEAAARNSGYCLKHGGRNLCRFQDCSKTSHYNGFCISHGGGRRCQMPNCTMSVQSRGLCFAHGGGKRCLRPGCQKGARRGGFCKAHL